jgi:hypothetical protein
MGQLEIILLLLDANEQKKNKFLRMYHYYDYCIQRVIHQYIAMTRGSVTAIAERLPSHASLFVVSYLHHCFVIQIISIVVRIYSTDHHYL